MRAAEEDDTPKQIVERFYVGLSGGEMKFELLGDDLEWITPASLPWTLGGAVEEGAVARYRGLEEFGRYLESLISSVDDMRAIATEVLELEDGRILAVGEETGRAAATGVEFRAPFAHLLTVVDGKITRLRGYVDTALMQQACRGA